MDAKVAAIIATVALVALIYAVYKMASASETSVGFRSSVQEENIRELFIKAVSGRLDKVAECVSNEFRKRYDLETAKGLVNVEAFKNNQEVKQILDQCAFNILQHMLFIVNKAASTDCGKRNIPAVVKWIVNNVEFRIYSDAEIEELVKQVEKMVCWSAETIVAYTKLTNEKVRPLFQELLLEQLREPFFSYDRYRSYMSEQINTKSVWKYKEDGLPANEYPDFISSITLKVLNRHLEGAVAKLEAHIMIANYLYGTPWCKDIPTMLNAMKDVPFEMYDETQTANIAKEILAKWCWNAQTIVGPTRQILNSIV
jgi:hypothetical protein